jgi:hypothetical protein
VRGGHLRIGGELEVFYLVQVPGGDRRYIERNMTVDRYRQLHRDYPGCRVLKIIVPIPHEDEIVDGTITVPLAAVLHVQAKS